MKMNIYEINKSHFFYLLSPRPSQSHPDADNVTLLFIHKDMKTFTVACFHFWTGWILQIGPESHPLSWILNLNLCKITYLFAYENEMCNRKILESLSWLHCDAMAPCTSDCSNIFSDSSSIRQVRNVTLRSSGSESYIKMKNCIDYHGRMRQIEAATSFQTTTLLWTNHQSLFIVPRICLKINWCYFCICTTNEKFETDCKFLFKTRI